MHVIEIGGSAGAVAGLARCAATDAVMTRLTITAADAITNSPARGARMGFIASRRRSHYLPEDLVIFTSNRR